VVFNLPRDIEAMFYSRQTVYARMPRPGEVEHLRAIGRPVIIHQPRGTDLRIPNGPGVVVRDVMQP
jgi:hypothetical protein